MEGTETRKELLALEKNRDYEGILEHKSASKEDRVVALIKLNRFEEAVKSAKNNTFEKAYCYYKLNKFKSCLKTAGKKEGKQWSSLRMQAYYGLNKYEASLEEAKELKKKGVTLVNYAAALGLVQAQYRAEHFEGETEGTKEKMQKVQEEIERVHRQSAEEEGYIKEEVEYNLAFSLLPNREEFAGALCKTSPEEKDTREVVSAQVSTLKEAFSEISPEVLTKRNRAIHMYNAEKEESPELQESLKGFQREMYYRGKIREFMRTGHSPAEVKEAAEKLKEGDASAANCLVSRLSRNNAAYLKAALSAHQVPTKSIRKQCRKNTVRM
ncbi:hypothetical protein NECID01_1525 [Nematocida sp. AWRm77]|nr:hypothetical protein NECID01_1525 [Nematocida sp. AWRm77]